MFTKLNSDKVPGAAFNWNAMKDENGDYYETPPAGLPNIISGSAVLINKTLASPLNPPAVLSLSDVQMKLHLRRDEKDSDGLRVAFEKALHDKGIVKPDTKFEDAAFQHFTSTVLRSQIQDMPGFLTLLGENGVEPRVLTEFKDKFLSLVEQDNAQPKVVASTISPSTSERHSVAP